MILILTITYLLGFGQDFIQTKTVTYAEHTALVATHQFFIPETTAGIVPAAYRSLKPIPNYQFAPLPEVGGILPGDSDGHVWSHQCDASRHPT